MKYPKGRKCPSCGKGMLYPRQVWVCIRCGYMRMRGGTAKKANIYEIR